jgi:hypothetical protein
MIEQASPVAKRRGETTRHLDLKCLAMSWAAQEGLSFVAPEVSFPHRRFRVDVAACAPARKIPSRKPVDSISAVLKAAVVFECKQGRGDLIRDNKRRALLGERLKALKARRVRLEALLHLHLPHLANGESLFPEFDSYRLREYNHSGYKKLLRQICISQRGVFGGTKFDRLLSYRVANLHYLVTEEQLMEQHEIPLGWGLLIRREERLELVSKPIWQAIDVEEQLIFLQRIAARNTSRKRKILWQKFDEVPGDGLKSSKTL